MIGIFKQKNPANLLVLLVAGILIKLPIFMSPHTPVMRPTDGALYDGILRVVNPLAKSIPLIYPLLTFGLLIQQAVALTRFINNQRMTNKSTYLPGMAYILVTSLLPEWNYFSAPLLVNTILLFILVAIFNVYNKQNVRGAIFNIGLALGIAGFLFVSSLALILWIFLAMAVIRPVRITEWLICLLGVTTPFYFYAIYLLINADWSWHKLLPTVTMGLPSIQQSAWLAGSVFLVMVPFVVGGYYVQENLRRMLINVRKGWSLLLLFLLAALLVPFINTTASFENWIIAIVPLAAFHGSAYLYPTWRPFPLILFWITVGFIIAYQYWGPGW